MSEVGFQRLDSEEALGFEVLMWMDVPSADYVAPAYHGQGIMTDAVKTIMTKWAIPRMNARKITAITFAGNIGSQRVFAKNGFKHIVTLPDYVNVRGSIKTLEIFGWTG